MSSIYQKGRDGFYYYQAYIYNPNSKKRDKKIYHSLGTKNKKIALQKQKNLDYEYLKKNNLKTILNVFYSARSFVIFSIIVFFFFLTSKNIMFKKVNSEKIERNEFNNYNKEEFTFKASLANAANDDILDTRAQETIMNTKKEVLKLGDLKEKKIPNYKMLNVFEGSKSFKQGKLHVLIDKKTLPELKIVLCDFLKSKHPQFENIIICLYSNETDEEILLIHPENNNPEKQRSSLWTGLYTYNKVEGVFFDPNPGKHLDTKRY